MGRDHKFRLGTTGRNGKKQLMPAWSTVSTQPLYKIKRMLNGCNRVTNASVLHAANERSEGLSRQGLKSPATQVTALVARVRHRRQYLTAL